MWVMMRAASEAICDYIHRFGRIPPQVGGLMVEDVHTKEDVKLAEYAIQTIWDHARFADDPMIEHQAKLWCLDLQKKVIEFGWEGRHTPDLLATLRAICGDLPVHPEVRRKAREALHTVPTIASMSAAVNVRN